jgi:flagellar basal-body rod protein FlgB
MLGSIGTQLERYLTLISVRQHLTAANIANADTPGFQTKDLDFQSELAGLLSPEHAAVVEVSGLPVKNDGNNVNLDREARLLAENALRFNVAASLLRSQLNSVRMAIQEGKSS